MNTLAEDRSIVLVIEDDSAIRNLLRAAFEGTPFQILEAETAAMGLELITRKRPNLVLLDLGLPDAEGIRIIQTVRGWSDLPIIVISGNGEEQKKVAALECGADDYVTKPFGINELLTRMRVALRHAAKVQEQSTESVVEYGDLKVDRSARLVFMRGERVHLTPMEYKLLSMLLKHAGKVVTHRQILSEVWGDEYIEEAQYLRVYVGYLRKKLEIDPDNPRILLTEPRIGYRLAT